MYLPCCDFVYDTSLSLYVIIPVQTVQPSSFRKSNTGIILAKTHGKHPIGLNDNAWNVQCLRIYISVQFVLAAKFMYPFVHNAQDSPHCSLYRLYCPLKLSLENSKLFKSWWFLACSLLGLSLSHKSRIPAPRILLRLYNNDTLNIIPSNAPYAVMKLTDHKYLCISGSTSSSCII